MSVWLSWQECVHYIVEHDYQLVKYKTADGRIKLAYLPPVEDPHQDWLGKVASRLKDMLPALKAKALEAGSAVNCDETWCRVRINNKYAKKYIWCLVNNQTKSVLFFYDNGSRGRLWNQLFAYLKDAL